MELEHEELLEPVSPVGQYMKSSALSLTIIGVLELEKPIDFGEDNAIAFKLLNDVFLPINPRFSSIMITEKNGGKKWKRVDVDLEDHLKIPIFPQGMSIDYYDKCFKNYIEKISMENLRHDRPLWEVHVIKYPTKNAAGNIAFKLHHALGDGYSLVGALLSCLQRVDNPSLPLTFPSRESKTNSLSKIEEKNSILNFIPRTFSRVFNTLSDFGFSILKSTMMKDDFSPIRSSEEGIEFRQITMADMTISLDRLKQITTRLNVTVNDVLVGAIHSGTRAYMEEMAYKSRKSNSTTIVLLNTRAISGYKSVSEMIKPNSEIPWGNHFAFLHVGIPKSSDSISSNPLNFVLVARQTILRKRNSAAIYLTAMLLEFVRKVRGSEAAARYFYDILRNSSLAITNVIGPLEKMALADHPVKGLYFLVAGVPLNIVCTIMSYAGNIRICFVVEKDFIDPYKLKSCVEKAFETIFQAHLHPTSSSI